MVPLIFDIDLEDLHRTGHVARGDNSRLVEPEASQLGEVDIATFVHLDLIWTNGQNRPKWLLFLFILWKLSDLSINIAPLFSLTLPMG